MPVRFAERFTIDKSIRYLLFSLLYSLFTFFVYFWASGVWAVALYAVGFFSFFAAYFDSVGRPVWWAVYFAAYLAAAHVGVAKAVFYVLMAVVLFGPLLYGRGVGRLASMFFFWAGAMASAVVVNLAGHVYRLVVPPLYPALPQASPSPLDVPIYLLGFYVLWRIHCLSSRWGGAVKCSDARRVEEKLIYT